MDPSRKVKFERLMIVVMLIIFGVTLRGSLTSIGLFGSSKNPAPTSVSSSPPPVPVTDRVHPNTTMSPTASSPAPKRERAGESEAQYTATTFRDPLVSLLPPEPEPRTPQKPLGTPAPALRPPPVTLQGMIWGGPRPQAVIDGEVYEVGDAVGGATIVAITRRGVTVEVQGTTFQLTPAPSLNNESARTQRTPTLYPY